MLKIFISTLIIFNITTNVNARQNEDLLWGGNNTTDNNDAYLFFEPLFMTEQYIANIIEENQKENLNKNKLKVKEKNN